MKVSSSVLLLLISLMAELAFAGSIKIENDKDDCLGVLKTMDVKVIVAGDTFYFDPECAYSFNLDFETEIGLKCKASSGMCTESQPRRKFEVSCDDGSTASVPIDCSKKRGRQNG